MGSANADNSNNAFNVNGDNGNLNNNNVDNDNAVRPDSTHNIRHRYASATDQYKNQRNSIPPVVGKNTHM